MGNPEPPHIQGRESWQRAVEALMHAAETGTEIDAASEKVEKAHYF